MKKLVLACALSSSLLLASIPSAMAESLNYNVVSLSESVSQSLESDLVRITLNIQQEGKDRNAVASGVTQATNQVLAKIKQDKNIIGKISNRSGYPMSDYVNGKTIKRGWRESVLIEIESSNFAAANQLMASVQNVANVQNMNYTVSDKKLKSFEKELTQDAIARFQDRAQNITQSLGARKYKIVNLDIGSTGAPNFRTSSMRYKAGMAADSAPIQESLPGKEDIRLTVSGSIQIQE